MASALAAHTIGFIGAGNMAEALIRGLVKGGHVPATRIVASGPRKERLDELNPGFVERVGEVGDVEIAPDADAVAERTADFVIAACSAPDPDGHPGPCGGILKPDIVYFGETVPPPRVAAAYALVDEADALLVAGSSLAVQSGLRFVRHAAAAGKPIAIVNRGATRGDRYAKVTMHAGTSEVLAALVWLLPSR